MYLETLKVIQDNNHLQGQHLGQAKRLGSHPAASNRKTLEQQPETIFFLLSVF